MFFKQTSYSLNVQTAKFDDDKGTSALTYSIVGTLNSDGVDDNGSPITVTKVSNTAFTLTGFKSRTNDNAQAGAVISGYVKGTDANGQSTFSRFDIVIIGKFIHLINSVQLVTQHALTAQVQLLPNALVASDLEVTSTVTNAVFVQMDNTVMKTLLLRLVLHATQYALSAQVQEPTR